MRLRGTLAEAQAENKGEHAETAVAINERLMKFLRSIDFLLAQNRRETRKRGSIFTVS
jgi:hypothetical protein